MNPIYLIPVAVIIIGVWSLPFMRDKILGLFTTQDQALGFVDSLIYQTQHGNDAFYTPQRIEAFVLQWINFYNMPLLTGEGRNLMFHYLNRTNGINLALSEGVLGVFVRYGIILGFLCYYSLIKSSRYFSSLNNKCPKVLFLVIFILANVSYYFWESPLCTLMWCWFFISVGNINKVKTYA